MRGEQRRSDRLLSYIRLEERIAADHPLRAIRTLVDEALGPLSGRFEELCSHTGRPSIAPDLQVFSGAQAMHKADHVIEQMHFVIISSRLTIVAANEGAHRPKDRPE